MIAKYNNKSYKLIDSIEINKSSREVTYSDLTLDFSNCSIEDLPVSQQEVKIYDVDNNLKFTGFVSEYKLPELTNVKTSTKHLGLSLFTPRQMTTKRTVTIIGTYTLEQAIRLAIDNLYVDGFILKEINVPDTMVTVKLISRTIEEVLNYFSNKYSLWWDIDELKEITINSIEYQFNKPIKKSININNYKDKIKGLLSISPSIQNSDYANIINVKNARIFYTNIKSGLNVTLSQNDRLDFDNPIDISYETARRVTSELTSQGGISVITNLQIVYNNDQFASIVSAFNTSSEQLKNGVNYKDIGKDDTTNQKFVLTMDSTFKNLATSVTYKGEGTVTIKEIRSETSLRYANMKLINWNDIKKMKGITTPSGQIEKVLDVEEGWFTVKELIDYIRSTFVINNKATNQINISYKKENDIKIGDRINIDLPEYFTQGEFVVTAISESKDWCNPFIYNVELRNTNLLENYIDLFRSSSDIEEQESQTEMEYVVEYSEDETIKEIHEIEFENNKNHTLNFPLNL